MSLLSILFKSYKSAKPPTCTAVIAASGLSQRCEGEDKLFYQINEKPVLAYTLETFQNCKLINDIIIVTREDKFEDIGNLCFKYGFKKVSKVIKGGSVRSESVMNGIYAANKKAHLIAIHDGARPCLSADILEKTIHAASKYQAAAPAVSISSTIKKIKNGVIAETVNREGLYEIQTPQIFRAEIIKAALTNAMRKSLEITDDCMAAEIIGVPVHVVEGSRKNIKITNNEDLKIVEAFLKEDEV